MFVRTFIYFRKQLLNDIQAGNGMGEIGVHVENLLSSIAQGDSAKVHVLDGEQIVLETLASAG